MGYNLDSVHPWCWSRYTTRVAKEHGGVWSNRWQGVLPKWTLPEGQYLYLPYDVWEVLAEAIVEQGGLGVGLKPGNPEFLEHWGALSARLVCSGLYKAMHKLLFQKHTAWVANEVAWHKISKVPHMRCHPRPGALKRRDWWIMEKQVVNYVKQLVCAGTATPHRRKVLRIQGRSYGLARRWFVHWLLYMAFFRMQDTNRHFGDQSVLRWLNTILIALVRSPAVKAHRPTAKLLSSVLEKLETEELNPLYDMETMPLGDTEPQLRAQSFLR